MIPQALHHLHNRYIIAFIVVVFLILVEFDYYLDIEINTNVLMFAGVAGLIGMALMYQKGHGRIHFGVLLFLIGGIMVLVAGVPLFGGASIGEHQAYWHIGDDSKKTPLAVLAFLGGVLIVVNFKAYMQNWIFARPMSMK